MSPSPLSALALTGAFLVAPLAADDCSGPDPIDIPTPAPGAEDLDMAASDFRCITTGTHVRHFYLWNDLGHLDEALAVASSETGGRYPVGTVIQLIPTEAMVKRFDGFNAETHDWEYFFMDVSESGTTIVERGSDPFIGPTGVNNQVANCHDCHKGAEPQWDLICEEGHGCDPLPFTPRMIEAVQQSDPRCN